MNAIVERLIQMRKTFNLTQKELAERIGASRGVISNIELGYVEPKEQLMKHLCDVMGVSSDWLLNGTGEMFSETGDEEKLAVFFGSVLNGSEGTFKHDFLSALASLDEDGWKMLQEVCELQQELYKKMQK